MTHANPLNGHLIPLSASAPSDYGWAKAQTVDYGWPSISERLYPIVQRGHRRRSPLAFPHPVY